MSPEREPSGISGTGTILVVEDNDTTRKMFRVTLELEGYRVLDAADAAQALGILGEVTPDLVLVDLGLPDINGVDLVAQIRTLSGLDDLPIVAVTGFLSVVEDAEVVSAGFDGVIVKPVEPTELGKKVRTFFSRPEERAEVDPSGKRVLIVDDNPVQRKLERLLLESAGWIGTEVASGNEALARAREIPPDVILSDVLMPGMDGFQLCAEVRQDPLLESIPVVLQSAHFASAVDRRIAEDAGAFALVTRDRVDRQPLTVVLQRALSGVPKKAGKPANVEDLRGLYTGRLVEHVEQLVADHASMALRASLRGAVMAAMSSVADVIAKYEDMGVALTAVLRGCTDAAGLSQGALFLSKEDDNGFSPVAVVGFDPDSVLPEHVDDVLSEALTTAGPVLVSPKIPRRSYLDLLHGLGASSLVVAPIKRQGYRGGLVLASAAKMLEGPEWAFFSQAIADHLTQAMAVGDAFSALRRSEARFRTLVEDTPYGMYRTDARGQIIDANRSFAEMLGYDSVRDLRGDVQTVGSLYADPEAWHRVVDRCVRGDPIVGFETRWRKRGGEEIVVRLSGTGVFRDDVGEQTFHMIVEDVTELHALEAQLRVAQRLDSVGQLAAGIAHDFNNLMTVVSANTELALQDMAEDAPGRGLLKEALKAVDKGRSLTRQLLVFGRSQTLETQVIDLAKATGEIEELLRRMLTENINLVVDLGPTGFIRIDQSQLQSVILNLAINARDAMVGGGTLRITTGRAELDPDFCLSHPELGPGSHAVLTIADTGEGMDEATLERIFEPFFSTKPVGQGTGLGLSMAYGIARQSSGSISVASAPGEGTTFTLYFPNVVGSPTAPSRSAAERTERGRRILLVEDDDAVRRGVVRMLERLGHHIDEADRPPKALDMLRGGGYDLVITDLIMPAMSGIEMMERAHETWPSLPVIYTSGYFPEGPVALPPGSIFLAKPFDVEALTTKLREAFASKGE